MKFLIVVMIVFSCVSGVSADAFSSSCKYVDEYGGLGGSGIELGVPLLGRGLVPDDSEKVLRWLLRRAKYWNKKSKVKVKVVDDRKGFLPGGVRMNVTLSGISDGEIVFLASIYPHDLSNWMGVAPVPVRLKKTEVYKYFDCYLADIIFGEGLTEVEIYVLNNQESCDRYFFKEMKNSNISNR